MTSALASLMHHRDRLTVFVMDTGSTWLLGHGGLAPPFVPFLHVITFSKADNTSHILSFLMFSGTYKMESSCGFN